ncbi:glycosyltransferase family 4 protein [Daejeonia sp. YH14]|uniref:glycosyltransferase family 4 protein n=1 Tax=Daejeonia sp. YH14 TaxID=3439042 RepID=UPI003F496BFB
MKILYCIPSLASKGGTEKVLLSKASYLAENGHSVTVLIADQYGKSIVYPFSDLVKVIDLKISEKLEGRIKYIGFLQNIFTLRKLYTQEIKKINPDIVIVPERGYEDFVIPYILKSIPKIREYHTSKMASQFFENELPLLQKNKRRLIRWFYEKQYQKYQQLVILTEKDRLFWNDDYKISVIPNLLERKSENSDDILQRKKNIIAVGSMVEDRKNFSSLIKIWSSIENDFPDWNLNIYGDGPYRNNYEKQIKELKLNHIFLKGISDTITEEYCDSQIFVMTSKGEGLPMVILEAQQQGLPAVVYDCYSGPSDILQNNAGGFLIKMNDEKDFIEKLKKLMMDEGLRKQKSEEANANAHRYLPEVIMPQWLKLFNKLLDK